MAKPILYAHPFSSYSQKAIIAFYEVDAPFELALLSPDNPKAGEALQAMWPMQRFPVLKVGEQVLLESSIIIEWVDRHAGGGRLIPKDADMALRTRMMDRVFDNYVMEPLQQIVFGRLRPEDAKDPFGEANARRGLDTIYPWLDDLLSGQPFAAGESFTMADCAAAPALFYCNWVHPFDGFTHLAGYYQRLRDRPSFRRAVDDARPYRGLFPGGVPEGRD